MYLTQLYNHRTFMHGANEGTKIINKTDFAKHNKERHTARQGIKIGDVINRNIKPEQLPDLYTVTEIHIDNIFTAIPYPQNKKNNKGIFINPVHVVKYITA